MAYSIRSRANRGSALAIVVLLAGCGYSSPSKPEDISARSPQVNPITATLDAGTATTTYTVTVTSAPGDLTFSWVPPTCGTNTQSRTGGASPTATLVWVHPASACPGPMEQPDAMIQVDVTSQEYTTTCRYQGAASGTGGPCNSSYTPGRY